MDDLDPWQWLNHQPLFDEHEGAHFVGGKPLRDGDTMELRLQDGHWATVIYCRKAHTRRGATLALLLHEGLDASMTLTQAMALRWPQTQAA